MPTFTTTDFPYLQQMAAIIDIEKAIAGNETVIALGIRSAIKQSPAAFILKEIREMIQDNRVIMEDMLGCELVKRITDGI